MHEFAIAQALAEQVQRHAPASGHVQEVEIRVGALRGLEPEALRMGWDATTFGTPIAGSVLRIETLPWTISCERCGRTWPSPVPFVSCECGNATPAPAAGDELELVALTIEEDS